jgi:hypothetical protein
MTKLPEVVHKEWDGFVTECDGRFYAWEYAVKVPPGQGKILLADKFKGTYESLEEAKSHIMD